MLSVDETDFVWLERCSVSWMRVNDDRMKVNDISVFIPRITFRRSIVCLFPPCSWLSVFGPCREVTSLRCMVVDGCYGMIHPKVGQTGATKERKHTSL
jgi:hypothetical protein